MTSVGLCRALVVSRLTLRMFSRKHSYEDAVCKLNGLQSNKATLEQAQRDIKAGKKCTNIEDMERYLLRTGITLSDLDKLSVIHVAGTKGKGSTSALCESILRHHGYRTGFYSSPHLVAVRERIRLDGRVIAEDKFADHFHRIYNMLDATKEYEGDMPRYFPFLTVLAYHMFLKEGVDVAIVEVGIGGRVDATNVIRKVPVVGITALGLDHTSILGSTLAQIAEAKAGIMKAGCAAYTVPQPPEAMAVLRRVAAELQCPLYVAPDYESYSFPNGFKSELQVDLAAYRTNASLAVQLAHAWMRADGRLAGSNAVKRSVVATKVILPNGFTDIESQYASDKRQAAAGLTQQVCARTAGGLRACRWAGRFHAVRAPHAHVYLDGAHTAESMEICKQWFMRQSGEQDSILIFSATGDRCPTALLRPLSLLPFKHVYFVIPTAYKSTNKHNDNYSVVEHKELIARCQRNADAWRQLNSAHPASVSVLECVSDALASVKRAAVTHPPAVLVTGSLHLVGHTLAILDPNLTT